MSRLLLLVMLVICALPQRTAAWWLTGHTVINRTGVATLPAEVPDFLRRQIDWIGARSMAPDSWRDRTEPSLRAIEVANHTWYLEALPVLPTLPRSRYEFIVRAHPDLADSTRDLSREISRTGMLPYAMIETYERLKVAFRTWRGLRARSEDTAAIEMDAAFYTGWLGHYVADGAMPLHTSVHHNGWVGENPKNYTRDRYIHERFEGEFVDLIELTEKDIRDRLPAPQAFDDPFAAFLAYLDRSHSRVEPVYVLEQQHALSDATSREGRELVYVCTAEGSAMLRDLIFSAWRASSL